MHADEVSKRIADDLRQLHDAGKLDDITEPYALVSTADGQMHKITGVGIQTNRQGETAETIVVLHAAPAPATVDATE